MIGPSGISCFSRPAYRSREIMRHYPAQTSKLSLLVPWPFFTTLSKALPALETSTELYLIVLLEHRRLSPDTLVMCSIWITAALELAKQQAQRSGTEYSRSARVAAAMHILCAWIRVLAAYVKYQVSMASSEHDRYCVLAVVPSLTLLVRMLRDNSELAQTFDKQPVYSAALLLKQTWTVLSAVSDLLQARLPAALTSYFAQGSASVVNEADHALQQIVRKRGSAHLMFASSRGKQSSIAPTPSHDSIDNLLRQDPEVLRYICAVVNQTEGPLSCDLHVRGVLHLKEFYRHYDPIIQLKPLPVSDLAVHEKAASLLVYGRFVVEWLYLVEKTRWSWQHLDSNNRTDNSGRGISPDESLAIEPLTVSEPDRDADEEEDDEEEEKRTLTVEAGNHDVPLSASIAAVLELDPSLRAMTGTANRAVQKKERELAAAKASMELKRQQLSALQDQANLERLHYAVLVRVVVPDTNCFLSDSQFALILQLLQDSSLRVVIPRMVLHELESMQEPKEGETKAQVEGRTVHDLAKEALTYLHDHAGTIMVALPDGTEFPLSQSTERRIKGVKHKNDEIILATAGQVAQHYEEMLTCKPGMEVTVKHVILLTDDNNMAVHARAQQLPACNAQELSALLRY
eukprot:m.101827 g.101827  ORF g.101827 m.101827 type:complete len:630 (-) comp14989_c0_seq1:212-2101(-)